MKQITLQFPSIIELIDFQSIVSTYIIHFNRTDLTLTGIFSEADIELAKAGYHAFVVGDAEQEKNSE
jgi:hypothetical protein